MNNWIENDKCSGCGACSNICPKQAISLAWDKDGFAVPVINHDLCIDCGQCASICPVRKSLAGEAPAVNDRTSEPKVYAAWSADYNTRLKSSSGGLFTEFARSFIAKGGYVAGAQYGEDTMVEHSLVNDEAGLEKLRCSKYVQSDTKDIFRQVKEKLNTVAPVLFCGTPCQVAGLYEYLGKDYDNLYTVDIICHGVNSPKAYRLWLDSLEKSYGSKATSVCFRNKEDGWKMFATRVDFENGSTYRKSRIEDWFMIGFLNNHLFLRPSCTECQFKGLQRRGDISLGDFWGINKELDSDEGVSLVFVNSNKGEKMIKELSSEVVLNEKSAEEAVAGNPMIVKSIEHGAKSKKFMSLINTGKDFREAIIDVFDEGCVALSVIVTIDKERDDIIPAIEKLLEQKYETLQLIVANVTESEALDEQLKKFAEENDKVKYMKLEGDETTARNAALQNASGAYIHFADLDSSFTEGVTYSEIINEMMFNEYDVYCFGTGRTTNKDEEIVDTENAYRGRGNSVAFAKLILSDQTLGIKKSTYGYGIHNKIFRKSVLKAKNVVATLERSGYHLAELMWLAKITGKVENVYFNPDVLYITPADNTGVRIPKGFSTKFYFQAVSKLLELAGDISDDIFKLYNREMLLQEALLVTEAKRRNFGILFDELSKHIVEYYENDYQIQDVVDMHYETIGMQQEIRLLTGRSKALNEKANKYVSLYNRTEKQRAHFEWMQNKTEKQRAHFEWMYNKTEKERAHFEWIYNKTEKQRAEFEEMYNATENKRRKLEILHNQQVENNKGLIRLLDGANEQLNIPIVKFALSLHGTMGKIKRLLGKPFTIFKN